MAWLYLMVAGAMEVVWASGLKFVGPARPALSLAVAGAMLASFGLLFLALRSLPVSIGYPVWTGIGAVGVFLVGIIVFRESADAWKLGCALCILVGIIGLKVAR
jgi:quaternary ammonium compound-resistance protein SugE